MKFIKFFIEDITFEMIDFCDRYIKKVITNAKHRFYRSKSYIGGHGLIIVDFDSAINQIPFEEKGFDEIFTTYITINDIPIPVHNPDLAEILLELPEVQRMIVLRTIVLGEKLTDIAKELGVSVPMVTKHRKKALATIKERMSERQC